MDMSQRSERAERMLDAGHDLLFALGYKRITVTDITSRAKVGRAAFYHYWPTKDELFYELLLREGLYALTVVRDAISQDHARVLLSNIATQFFLLRTGRKLSRALYSNDTEALGNLQESKVGKFFVGGEGSRLLSGQIIKILREHGLVRTDQELDFQIEAVDSIWLGMFMQYMRNGDYSEKAQLRHAEVLRSVMIELFESATTLTPLDLESAAKTMLDFFSKCNEMLLKL